MKNSLGHEDRKQYSASRELRHPVPRRVAGRCCHRPAPSEPDGPVSRHPAQIAHKRSLAPETRSWWSRTCALLPGCPHASRWETAPVRLSLSSALSPQVGWTSVGAPSDQTEVCPLARGGMLSNDAPPIRAITVRPSLPPPSSTPTAISLPYGMLTLTGAVGAYHVPQSSPDGLGLLWTPVARVSTAGDWRAPAPATCHFGASLPAAWACCMSRRVNEHSPRLTIPSILAPSPPAAGRDHVGLTACMAVIGLRVHCQRALYRSLPPRTTA